MGNSILLWASKFQNTIDLHLNENQDFKCLWQKLLLYVDL